MNSRHRLLTLAAAALLTSPFCANSQVTVYDSTTGMVTIPSVSVGTSTFSQVRLLNTGNFVFALQDATEQKPASPGVAAYNSTNGLLSMPAVKVGNDTYLDVTLRNTGNYVFALQGATLLPTDTVNEIKAFMVALDALWATAVPTSGTQALSLHDSCFLGDGRTRAYLISNFDANLTTERARQAELIGSKRVSVQVLALRNLRNLDGSSRREIDVQYDLLYQDGSVAVDVKETLVSGSSAGTPGCTTPQTGDTLRLLGNQRRVGFALQARAIRFERYFLSTGAPVNPSVLYRRDIRFNVTDPLGIATYVVVSGPRPAADANGTPLSQSWKMVSPRLLRSAPELKGKTGNYVNLLDHDNFRWCAGSEGNLPLASEADCVQWGAPGDNWGITSTYDNLDDKAFNDLGWVVGGVYKLDVYNDDGWKTVNGHANSTPIATHYETLKALPSTFVEMAGSGPGSDGFARISFGTPGAVGLRNNAMSTTPTPISLSWLQPPVLPNARPLRLQHVHEYVEGSLKRVPDSSPASWFPGLFQVSRAYPGPNATSVANWPVSQPLTDMLRRTYFEYRLEHVDRNQGVVQSRVTFQ